MTLPGPLEVLQDIESIGRHQSFVNGCSIIHFHCFFITSSPVLSSLYSISSAMHLLLQQGLHRNEIDAAEVMLNDFCALLPELYGEMNFTINAHLLLHLTHYVRLWGPL